MQTWYPPAPAALPAAGPGPVAYIKRSAGLGLGADYSGWVWLCIILHVPGLVSRDAATTGLGHCNLHHYRHQSLQKNGHWH